MNYEIVFESNRILFVKLSVDLIDAYLEMINDENVQKNIGKKRDIYTYEQELEWVLKNIKENSIILSMIDKETHKFIGNISINKIENNVGELGISITPNEQNKHYGQEAITAFLDYCYKKIGLDGIDLNVFDFNKRAIHCYEKLGFVKDGVGKHPNDIHMVMKK